MRERNSINLQSWIPIPQATEIAEYMEMAGIKQKRLADLNRIAIDYFCLYIEREYGIKPRGNEDAIRRLEELGYCLDSSKKYKSGMPLEGIKSEEKIREEIGITPEQIAEARRRLDAMDMSKFPDVEQAKQYMKDKGTLVEQD
jgi:hypothetical protein